MYQKYLKNKLVFKNSYKIDRMPKRQTEFLAVERERLKGMVSIAFIPIAMLK